MFPTNDMVFNAANLRSQPTERKLIYKPQTSKEFESFANNRKRLLHEASFVSFYFLIFCICIPGFNRFSCFSSTPIEHNYIITVAKNICDAGRSGMHYIYALHLDAAMKDFFEAKFSMKQEICSRMTLYYAYAL